MYVSEYNVSPPGEFVSVLLSISLSEVKGGFGDIVHELWSCHSCWTRADGNRCCGASCHLQCHSTENWGLSGSLLGAEQMEA